NAVMLALGGRRGGHGAVRLDRRDRWCCRGRELEAAHVAAACERERRTQQRCHGPSAAHSPVSPSGRPIHDYTRSSADYFPLSTSICPALTTSIRGPGCASTQPRTRIRRFSKDLSVRPEDSTPGIMRLEIVAAKSRVQFRPKFR